MEKTIYDLPEMMVKSCKKNIIHQLRVAIVKELDPKIREGMLQAIAIVKKEG